MLANYHMTENKYLESILNNGLIPQQGIRSNLIGDSKNAVFYSKEYEGVIAMFFMMIERFIQYRDSIGDVHIDAYNNFIKMADRKKQQGIEISETLQEAINNEKKIVDVINAVRNASDWKEFFGEGVCLKINHVHEENSDLPEFTFYNSWTTSIIPPEDISVIILKNRETGDFLSSKYDVVNYFISKISLDRMRTILYDTDSKESKRESHLLWQIMSKYYIENRDNFESSFEKYDIVEMDISSYLNNKNSKSKGM